ncbi:hypothetical protein ACV3X3_15255 [Clostridium perfringens]
MKNLIDIDRGSLLQTKLKENMNKVIMVAKNDGAYNSKGEYVLSKNDEWREDNEWNRTWDENENNLGLEKYRL